MLVETETFDISPISGFFGDYRWLSNFYSANISYRDIVFPTIEHAYVYCKYANKPVDLEQFLDLTAGQVKRLGQSIDVRSDFDDIKVDLMVELVCCKFSDANPILKQKLIDTSERYISETNSWGDTFWGVNTEGVGLNLLGKIIMARREQLLVSEA